MDAARGRLQTTVVVGAGVVGLHAALALAARPGRGAIVVLEREPHLGEHASGRNSQVIHAGFAYPPGSLKARLCLRGNALSYAWLERLGVTHARSGKWIVAWEPAEVAALDEVLAAAHAAGAREVRRASPAEFAAAEPGCNPVAAALFSPSSGLVDAAGYLAALARHFAAQPDCTLLRATAVSAIDPERRVLATSRGELAYDLLVNAAGLWADEVYRAAGGTRDLVVRGFKGEYYTWRRGPIATAVYPVPVRFLAAHRDDPRAVSHMGIHVQRDTAGTVYVGPTQVDLSAEGDGGKRDHRVETAREVFLREAARYAPVAHADDLAPAWAGVRAKVFEAGQPLADFQVFREGAHIHMIGIESPGLTAAPALGEQVAALAQD